MIQILYTADHAERASDLAVSCGSAHHGLVSTKPITKTGLDTLIFWGHGDSFKLCGLSSQEMVKLIAEWKKQNPKLETVELITCNARHFTGNGDSFANQVKSGLRSGILNSTRNLTIKALPVGASGSKNAFSILLYEPKTKSWVYVTGPGKDDKIMWEGANQIKFDKIKGVDGKESVVSFSGDIAQRANNLMNRTPNRNWTMNYGYLSSLRKMLVTI